MDTYGIFLKVAGLIKGDPTNARQWTLLHQNEVVAKHGPDVIRETFDLLDNLVEQFARYRRSPRKQAVMRVMHLDDFYERYTVPACFQREYPS